MPERASQSVARVAQATFACDEALAGVVAARARYRDFERHATIIASGTATDQIYLLVAGHARMLAFAIDGRMVVVHDFLEGDIFGEGGLVGQALAADEVTAVDAVGAGVFASQDFIALMTNYSCIGLAVSRMVIARLANATQRLVEGATLSAVGRIHAELLRQARAGEAMTIRPAPVLSAFALGVQSTRETVSRTINALQKRGIIRRDDDALTVVAPHRLEELIC